MYHTNQLGIVYGPYGATGFIQRQNLQNAGTAFCQLFRWAKKVLCALL